MRINILLLMIAGTQGDFETKLVILFEKMIAMYGKVSPSKVMVRKNGYEYGEMLYCADGYVAAWFMWQYLPHDGKRKKPLYSGGFFGPYN